MSPGTGEGDDKVVPFRPPEISPEERARRLQTEVERLARQPVTEWMFWIDYGVGEQFGVDKATLKRMVEATVRANEKKRHEAKAADRQREQRIEKQRANERREHERKRREQEREQERADKEAA